MTPTTLAGAPPRVPLFARVLAAGLAGVAAGTAAGSAELLGVSAADVGDAGMLVIRALKVLATPLIFLAVADAALRIEVPKRKAALLVAVASANAAVAVAVALGLAHVLDAGHGAFAGLVGPGAGAASAHVSTAGAHEHTKLADVLPASIVEPFATGSIVAVVVLALLVGLSLRAVRATEPGVAHVESALRAALAACTKVLTWVVACVPFAVFAVVTAVVAKTGLALARDLGVFLGVMLLGLALHVLVYYALVVAALARRSPRGFFRGAADALATALSCGSSLATLPITLRCLDDMKVTPGSARLATCVGTNLNHDGIIASDMVVAAVLDRFAPDAAEVDARAGASTGAAEVAR